MSDINLDYRPTDYFGAVSRATHLLRTVKGAARQQHIRTLIEANRLDELDDWMAKESLTEEARSIAGRIHPMFMGGEFLPDLRKGEIEVARISLRSTTADVISVRATRGKDRIRYRIVDEYFPDSPYTGATSRRTSIQPLTLGQLEQFIERAGAGMDNIRLSIAPYSNEGPEDFAGFLRATSPFYPELDALYKLRFEELAKSMKRDDDDEDATEAEAALSAQSIQPIERI